jgi:hypothetical protein
MDLNLETTDLRVVKPSEVILVRHFQNHVWRVTVDGEEMICKASLDLFEHAIGDELAAYLKIRVAAARGVKLRVPELKGRYLPKPTIPPRQQHHPPPFKHTSD